MKVGILSMQRIQNYGSFLQAYGLKSLLEELGANVEFVDYKPGEPLIANNEKNGNIRKIKKAFEAFEGKAPLKEKVKFVKYKKDYSKNYYPLLGISSQYNYSPELDLLVIGSDEVFNCVQDNPNVGFTPELFGQNAHAKHVISYAGSFGNTTLEKLKKHKVDESISKWFSNFDDISVRDQNSSNIVEALIGKKPKLNLDPVLMYDYMSSGKIPETVDDNNYLILYGYSGRFTADECKAIRLFAKKKGLKIYCIGGLQDCCDKYLDCDPFKVISYFKNAKYVITDTFHGTIMSIITHQNFVTLIRNQGYGNSEKLIDLIQRLKLIERRLDTLSDLENKLNTPIDFTETDQIINTERIKTREYLKKWIK